MTRDDERLKKIALVNTPKNWGDLQRWLDLHSGGEKVVAWTAAAQGWNLAISTTENLEDDCSLKGRGPGGDILEP